MIKMNCKSIERKIFTVYNKNGAYLEFDANQGYFWRHGIDKGFFFDKVNYSVIEVLHNEFGLVAVFTQADVCNLDAGFLGL